MTSREIVERAIRFQNPPRMPAVIPAFGTCDIVGTGIAMPPGLTSTGTGTDPWGCRWQQSEVPNMGQVRGHPITDLRQIDGYPMPDYSQDHWYRNCEAAIAHGEAEGKFITAGIFMVLFERMHSLCGMDTVLMGLLGERQAMETLADRIVETHLRLIEGFAQRFGRRIHSLGGTDDWGSQQAAFVSYDLWMDFFAPRYKRLYDAAHANGWSVFLHSCGKVTELLEGFIRVGIDCANLQQPRALGIAETGRRYRGRITFESLADIQATLPGGDAAAIAADADALAEDWMSPAGGFILSDYGDDRAIGAAPNAKQAMYDAFSRVSERLYGNPLPPPTESK